MGARPLTALTEDAFGRVLAARGAAGDAERARTLLASAKRTAEELGLTAITGRPPPPG
jgi:hypothetical protein